MYQVPASQPTEEESVKKIGIMKNNFISGPGNCVDKLSANTKQTNMLASSAREQ